MGRGKTQNNQKLEYANVLLTQETQKRHNITKFWEDQVRLRYFLDHIVDAFFVHDFQGRFIGANEQACQMFGYSWEEFCNLSVPDIDLQYDFPGRKEVLAQLGTNQTVAIDSIHQRKNGSVFPVELRVGKMVLTHCEYVIAFVRDITELKQTQKALQEKEDRWHQILDQIADALFLIDVHGHFVEVNQQACVNLGYTREELLQLSIPDIDPLYGKEQFEAFMKRVQSEKNSILESYHRRKNGTTFPVEIHCGHVSIDGHEYKLALARDIAERKQAEEALYSSEKQLKQQKRALEQKNIALREILEQIEIEKKQIKDDIAANVQKTLLPILEKLKHKGRAVNHKYVTLLQNNLEGLTSKFGSRITESMLKLTPKEIELCNMIKEGLSSKEIAQMLNLSLGTIEAHRNRIRKKLGILRQNVNLNTYLSNLML